MNLSAETPLQQENSELAALVQRASGTSVQEIQKLIAELQILRDMLQNEAARVQREIVKYAILTQGARQSMRTISESLSFWKNDRDIPRVSARTFDARIKYPSVAKCRAEFVGSKGVRRFRVDALIASICVARLRSPHDAGLHPHGIGRRVVCTSDRYRRTDLPFVNDAERSRALHTSLKQDLSHGSEPGKPHSRARLRDLELAWLRTRSGRSALACGRARNLDGIDGRAPRQARPTKEAPVACTFQDHQDSRAGRLIRRANFCKALSTLGRSALIQPSLAGSRERSDFDAPATGSSISPGTSAVTRNGRATTTIYG